MLAKKEVSTPRPLMRRESLPEQILGKKIDNVSNSNKATALAIAKVCAFIMQKEKLGFSRNQSVRLMLAEAELGELDVYVSNALREAAVGNNQLPSRSTILGWVAKFDKQGVNAVIKQHKGRVRIDQGWESLAVDLYNVPSKVSAASVARDLRRLHAFTCTNEQVSNYLSALPTSLGKNSPARLGQRLHKLQQKPFVKRHCNNLQVGACYMADGYRLDVYLAHPVTGDIWRAEIMHVIDLRTRYLVGYRIMANERGYDVMVGWAEIFAEHDHVPPLLYVDNGSGYKNDLADDDICGYYTRAGVQFVIHSLPMNPHGKGHIEQYHRIVRDDFLKAWKPEFYCGDDMSNEVRNKIVTECKAKRLIPPSLAEFVTAYNAWIKDDYHYGRPHPDDKDTTRGAMWEGLDPIKPHATVEEMSRPQVKRTVTRSTVQLNNRRYKHPDLYEWNGQELLVEFDMLDHTKVTVRDKSGRLICDAPMVEAISIIGESFLADVDAKARDASIKRKQKKLDEDVARYGRIIDVDSVVDNAQTLMQPVTPELPNPTPSTDFSLDDFLNN